MGEQRRSTAIEAARTFEDAARKAETTRNYGLAAALYRAALLVLTGESADDMHALTDAGCNASLHGELPQRGQLPHPADRS